MFRKILALLLFFGIPLYGIGISRSGNYFSWPVEKINEEISILQNKKNNISNNMKLGILYISLALKNPPIKGASYKANKYIEKYIRKMPHDSIALCYFALSYSLMGRDDKNIAKKTYYVNKCFKYYDKALKIDPDNWYIHFMRGNSYINLPSFFGKEEEANRDFRFVENKFLKGEKISDSIMASVFYYRGEEEKSSGKLQSAINYWKKALKYARKSGNIQIEHRAKRMLSVFND